jgi:hypothetical protein
VDVVLHGECRVARWILCCTVSVVLLGECCAALLGQGQSSSLRVMLGLLWMNLDAKSVQATNTMLIPDFLRFAMPENTIVTSVHIPFGVGNNLCQRGMVIFGDWVWTCLLCCSPNGALPENSVERFLRNCTRSLFGCHVPLSSQAAC